MDITLINLLVLQLECIRRILPELPELMSDRILSNFHVQLQTAIVKLTELVNNHMKGISTQVVNNTQIVYLIEVFNVLGVEQSVPLWIRINGLIKFSIPHSRDIFQIAHKNIIFLPTDRVEFTPHALITGKKFTIQYSGNVINGIIQDSFQKEMH